MAYPSYAPQATPQPRPMMPPPQVSGGGGFDMGAFDREFAELQSMLADLDGDGVPDVAQGGGRAPVGGPAARIPVDARSEQDYQDQFGGAPPAAPRRPPPRPGAAGGPDVAALGEEARARIAAGEPRESVIQDLFMRVTRGRAEGAQGSRTEGVGPQFAEGPSPTMTDANPMLAPPMSMPQGRHNQPRFGALSMPPDDGVMTTRDVNAFDPSLESPGSGVSDFERLRQEANAMMAPAVPPPQEEEPAQPWRGWSSVGDMISNAYDNYVPEMPSGQDVLEGLGTAAGALGDTLVAAQATGGPPGAILGSLGRGIANAPATIGAVRNRLADSVRNLTADGRAWNRATDSMRESAHIADEIARRGGDARGLPETANRLIARTPRPDHSPLFPDSLSQEMNALSLRNRVGDAATEFMTRDMMQYPALPAPRPGQPNRLIPLENQPGLSPIAHERAGGAARAARDAERARDMVRGTARSPNTQALDDSLDGFMQTLSQVPKEHTSSIPRLIKQQAEEAGVSLGEVVSALERRGYRIDADSVPQHAYQARTPDGRWSKLDPEWSELLSVIRERAGRPTVGRN